MNFIYGFIMSSFILNKKSNKTSNILNKKQTLHKINFISKIKQNYHSLPKKIKLTFNFLSFLPIICIGIVTFSHITGLTRSLDFSKDILVYPYSDGMNNRSGITSGNTIIHHFYRNESSFIYLEYLLGDRVKQRFAGIEMRSDTNASIVDMRKFDYCDIECKVLQETKLQFYVFLCKDPLTIKKISPAEICSTNFKLAPEDSTISIPLNRLRNKHNEWYNPKTSNNPLCVGIALQSGDTVPTVYKFKVFRVHFRKDNRIFLKNLLLSMFGYYGILVCILFLSILLNRITLIPYIRPLNTDLIPEKELDRIKNYIAQNYSDQNINIEKTARNTGISLNRISEILFRETGMRFNQYLNYVRITAAKGMLRNTDHHILRIALDVGYSNVGHFNRKFREFENCTPGEHRRKAKNQKNEKDDQ